MSKRVVLRSRRVWLPRGELPTDLVVEHGVITAIEPYGSQNLDGDSKDFGECHLLPGLVDTHVHLNEPGRTEWEGFSTGTLAAKSGGITTLVDMPLNSSPVTTTVEALRAKQQAAIDQIHVDVAMHAGVVPDSASQIGEIIRHGAVAAKAFLCESGIDEFPASREQDIADAMNELSSLGRPLLVHAEWVQESIATPASVRHADHLASRPPSMERSAIELLLRLASETGCHVHVVHLADADSLPLLASARSQGIPVTVETCPHYLTFCAEEIPDGRTDFKCAPPIRGRSNREKLWQGLRDGLIDMIVSDHSPCPPAMKSLDSGRFDKAWGGISSLQIGLPIIWTEASKRGFGMKDVVRWMSEAPAELVGISAGIRVGNPAHFCVFSPNDSWVVDQHQLEHRHPITPYHERLLKGKVVQTIVHGYQDDLPHGQVLNSKRNNASDASPREGVSTPPISVSMLDGMSPADAEAVFLACCGSRTWVQAMLNAGPFGTLARLHQTAEEAFEKLNEEDWLEAFASHPKIGELDSSRMQKAGNKQWSSKEQAGAAEADDATREALRQGNLDYENRFPMTFIVCATGKSAAQMLGILQSRLRNDLATELNEAAEQQRQITHLRISKAVAPIVRSPGTQPMVDLQNEPDS